MILLGNIWYTSKSAFRLYKDILFGDGPIIRFKLRMNTVDVVMMIWLYLLFFSIGDRI